MYQSKFNKCVQKKTIQVEFKSFEYETFRAYISIKKENEKVVLLYVKKKMLALNIKGKNFMNIHHM